jgi:hypothetical protein
MTGRIMPAAAHRQQQVVLAGKLTEATTSATLAQRVIKADSGQSYSIRLRFVVAARRDGSVALQSGFKFRILCSFKLKGSVEPLVQWLKKGIHFFLLSAVVLFVEW